MKTIEEGEEEASCSRVRSFSGQVYGQTLYSHRTGFLPPFLPLTDAPRGKFLLECVRWPRKERTIEPAASGDEGGRQADEQTRVHMRTCVRVFTQGMRTTP